MESSKEIEKRASRWLARRDLTGEWSDADQAALDEWLSASTAHRVAYVRLAAAWAQAGRLQAVGAGLPREAPPPPTSSGGRFRTFRSIHPRRAAAPSQPALPHRTRQLEPARPSAPGRWVKALAAAAASAIVALGGAYAWFVSGQSKSYATEIGGLQSVPMNDGSRLVLNTDTRLRVTLRRTERRVDLDSGEAYFEVVKDPERPFEVWARGKRIVVVGTKFAVRNTLDGLQVVVIDGRVRLEDPLRGAPTQIAYVNAGEVARAEATGIHLEDLSPSATNDSVSWQRGVVIFRDRPIRDVILEFNRYSVRKIVVADPSIADIHFSGSFHSKNADGFIRLITERLPIRSEQRGDQIVLTRR